jgi:hypothetical protein
MRSAVLSRRQRRETAEKRRAISLSRQCRPRKGSRACAAETTRILPGESVSESGGPGRPGPVLRHRHDHSTVISTASRCCSATVTSSAHSSAPGCFHGPSHRVTESVRVGPVRVRLGQPDGFKVSESGRHDCVTICRVRLGQVTICRVRLGQPEAMSPTLSESDGSRLGFPGG